ncbi:MAG: sulfopyruvate decarboxylase subunit alpha [Deltaproteobacteria bacterium]|nr:sulfopyruvate decarboxylase subunit alpha [Deltaproteobacteria bacterium]
MHSPEKELISILKGAGVDLLATLPCDRVRNLIALADASIDRIPLTREEDGVGICAGAALGGRRPAMIVQSSGIGNMINALLSLTGFYELPLALFVSQRGVYKEGIDAQVPMGKVLPGLFESVGIGYTLIDRSEAIPAIGKELESLYREKRIHAFLLSPALWEGSPLEISQSLKRRHCEAIDPERGRENPAPVLTRYGVLSTLCPELEGQAVICNLGVPSKELHALLPQPSNFYMLGSMGLATPIGLGVAFSTDKPVFVIDGDGSLLMNPGTLATVAMARPGNLTIIAVDNASYGSTGDQPTLTAGCVDLELVARGFGICNSVKAASREELREALQTPFGGALFVHALALPGNAAVPNIPLGAREIKEGFQAFLESGRL